MTSLGFTIALLLSGFVAWIFWQHVRLNQLQTVASLPLVSHWLPVLCSGVLLAMTLVIYSQTGRYSDWDQGKLDEHIDYLVAADITKALRHVDDEPKNPLALMSLVQAYSAGGKYGDAVQTLDKLLALVGEDAEVLGAKANALYYRDGRQITAETQAVIVQALAIMPFEPQTRMLQATDAYLHGRYLEAIDHWQALLSQPSVEINREAILNAIGKAQSKLNESGY
ncbi:tetratricopeptide repeat protein [Shewanella sp.]|uniref:tetratricopeptide repeat protein n=1 Tax=Shewanella sp. TaxID=50422 RepID=UPI001B3D3BB7|nr:tetratricopeptide repeat protein [Shewanella sp.]MBP6519779.1 tetratricopeptide repeat protein [Shewanella sp.]